MAYVPMLRSRVALIAATLFFAGCESDPKQLERLRREAALADLSFSAAQQRMVELSPAPDTSLYRITKAALDSAEIRAILAERELNRFLGR